MSLYFLSVIIHFLHVNAGHSFHESPRVLTAHDLEGKAPLQRVKGVRLKRPCFHLHYSSFLGSSGSVRGSRVDRNEGTWC